MLAEGLLPYRVHELYFFMSEKQNTYIDIGEVIEQKALALQKVNQDLAQKNQELDAIVQTAPDIIFSRQADGGREYISSRFYEYTGAAPSSARYRRQTARSSAEA